MKRDTIQQQVKEEGVSQFGLGMALGLPIFVGLGLVVGALTGRPAYGLLYGSVAGVNSGVAFGLVLEHLRRRKIEAENR